MQRVTHYSAAFQTAAGIEPKLIQVLTLIRMSVYIVTLQAIVKQAYKRKTPLCAILFFFNYSGIAEDDLKKNSVFFLFEKGGISVNYVTSLSKQ